MVAREILNLKFLLVISLVFVITSCNSLTDPYIDARDVSYTVGNSTTRPCESSSTMANAKKCIQGLQSAYLSAMSEQAKLSAWTGIGLIPLTTFVSAVAINDNHQTKITDFGLGAAGLYGVSNWLSKPQRTQIYGAGIQALQCAMDATEGFDIPGSVYEQFVSDLEDLDLSRVELKNTIARINSWLNLNEDTSAASLTNAKNMITLAEASLTEAANLADQGYVLTAKFVRAPGALVGAANGINGKINSALTNTIQSLASLPGVLSGVTDLYSNLLTSHEGLTSIGGAGEAGEDFRAESSRSERLKLELAVLTDELLQRHSNLALDAMKVSQFMKIYTPEPPTATLASCGVDTTDILTSLSLQPQTLSFSTADTSPKSVSITGGSGQYVYNVNTQALDVLQTPAFGSLLTVSIDSDNAAAGSYIIVVQDINGNASNVQIVVTEATSVEGAVREMAQEEDGEIMEGEVVAECSLIGNLIDDEAVLCSDKNKTTLLQTILQGELEISDEDENSPFVDGNYGQRTREAIIEYLEKNSADGTSISESVIDAILELEPNN